MTRTAGTLYLNIDTTMHDVYSLGLIMRSWYGTWSLPKDATPDMRILADIMDDRNLVRERDYDPEPERFVDQYCSIVKEDKEDRIGLNSAISLVIWDAHVSYYVRALRFIDSMEMGGPNPVPIIKDFLWISNRLKSYHFQIKERNAQAHMQSFERMIKEATTMWPWEIREKMEAHKALTHSS